MIASQSWQTLGRACLKAFGAGFTIGSALLWWMQ
jgi:hypothetical protein